MEVVRVGIHTTEETKMDTIKELMSMCEMPKNLKFQTEKVTEMDKEVCVGMEYPTQVPDSLIIFLKTTVFRIHECFKMNVS